MDQLINNPYLNAPNYIKRVLKKPVFTQKEEVKPIKKVFKASTTSRHKNVIKEMVLDSSPPYNTARERNEAMGW